MSYWDIFTLLFKITFLESYFRNDHPADREGKNLVAVRVKPPGEIKDQNSLLNCSFGVQPISEVALSQ